MRNRERSSLRGILAALLLGLGLTVGCGGDEADAPPSVDVTGTWTGTAFADQGGAAAVVLTATQTEAAVSGTCSVDGAPMTVTGKVSGNKWSGTLTADWGTITYKMTVSGNTATGTGSDGQTTGGVTMTRSAN